MPATLGSADTRNLPLERLILALVVLGTLGRIVFVWNASILDLLQRSTDDAYYYFNVAENIVEGFGVTFDRINPTNGFHPLWMLCLLPVSTLAGHDRDTALRAIFSLVALITGGGVWAAYKTISLYASRTAALFGVGLLFVPVFLNSFLNGLETGLLLLLLFGAAYAISRYDLLSPVATRSEDLALGALLALIVLCRLDAIFVACAIIAGLWVRWWTCADRRIGVVSVAWKTLRVSLLPIGTVGAYLLWNVAMFGHASPISGAVKSTFPISTFTWSRLVDPHRMYGEAQLLLTACGFLWLGPRRRQWTAVASSDPRQKAAQILVALWVGSLAHLLYSTLYMDWAAHWWHFASYTPMTIITAALVFDGECARSRRPAFATVAGTIGLVAVIGLGSYVDVRTRGAHHRPWYDASMWARANLPENAVIGMTDAGLFSYFSRRRTVNLDGVINGYDYQQALRDHRLAEYLKSSGVTHIADYEVRYRNGTYTIRLPARLYRQRGGAIATTQTAEIYGGIPYPELFGPDDIHFAIWDLDRLRIIDDVSRAARENGIGREAEGTR